MPLWFQIPTFIGPGFPDSSQASAEKPTHVLLRVGIAQSQGLLLTGSHFERRQTDTQPNSLSKLTMGCCLSVQTSSSEGHSLVQVPDKKSFYFWGPQFKISALASRIALAFRTGTSLFLNSLKSFWSFVLEQSKEVGSYSPFHPVWLPGATGILVQSKGQEHLPVAPPPCSWSLCSLTGVAASQLQPWGLRITGPRTRVVKS